MVCEMTQLSQLNMSKDTPSRNLWYRFARMARWSQLPPQAKLPASRVWFNTPSGHRPRILWHYRAGRLFPTRQIQGRTEGEAGPPAHCQWLSSASRFVHNRTLAAESVQSVRAETEMSARRWVSSVCLARQVDSVNTQP